MARDVLLLCGSYHPRSANRAVLDVVAQRLMEKGCSVRESVGLDRLPNLSADQLEPVPDLVAELRQQLADADGAVVAGPEYGGGLAGSLKNALDWCVGSAEGFYGRPVVIASAGTSGGPNALHQLARTLLWQGGHVVGFAGVVGPKRHATGMVADEGVRSSLRVLGDQLVASLALEESERALVAKAVGAELGITTYPHVPRSA